MADPDAGGAGDLQEDELRLEEGWYAVDVEMWTDTGRSDLTLQLELRRATDGTLRTSFEDLHVL